MKNSIRILTVLLLILMAGFAILFPAALFMGFSYDAIAAVLLVMLVIVLAVLRLNKKGREGGGS